MEKDTPEKRSFIVSYKINGQSKKVWNTILFDNTEMYVLECAASFELFEQYKNDFIEFSESLKIISK